MLLVVREVNSVASLSCYSYSVGFRYLLGSVWSYLHYTSLLWGVNQLLSTSGYMVFFLVTVLFSFFLLVHMLLSGALLYVLSSFFDRTYLYVFDLARASVSCSCGGGDSSLIMLLVRRCVGF